MILVIGRDFGTICCFIMVIVAQTCAWLTCMDSRVVVVSCLMLPWHCYSCCFATLVQPKCFACLKFFVHSARVTLSEELLALLVCMFARWFSVVPVFVFCDSLC